MHGQENSGLYSHPGIYIEEHIDRCLFYSDCNVLLDDIQKDILQITVALHDFGKCTSYFQLYITGDPALKWYENHEQLKAHAYLSGLYALYCVLKYFGINPFSDRTVFKNMDVDKILLCVASYLSCKRHHGLLDDLSHEIKYLDKGEYLIMLQQLESIDTEKVNRFIDNLQNLKPELKELIKIDKDFLFKKWIQEEKYKEFIKHFTIIYSRNPFSEYHFSLFQYMFSLLLSSDKLEAGIKTDDGTKLTVNREHVYVSHEIVDKYKKENLKDTSDINLLREKAYQQVLESIENVDLSKKIYTITLPTGMGKTLTGLAVALKLREKLGDNRRIIYSLPFISIID